MNNTQLTEKTDNELTDIVKKHKPSEFIYKQAVRELLNRNEKLIHSARNTVSRTRRNTYRSRPSRRRRPDNRTGIRLRVQSGKVVEVLEATISPSIVLGGRRVSRTSHFRNRQMSSARRRSTTQNRSRNSE